MDYKTLRLSQDASIATITLSRPEKRNAISYELIEELLGVLDEVAHSSALVLILTGEGKAFCSGMDLENLKALSGRSSEQNLKDSETMAHLFRALYDFPRPTIAAVNGAAIAGGCGLATLCDFTLAVPGCEVWLHRSTNWIRAGNRFDFSAAANRGKTCARLAAYGQNH